MKNTTKKILSLILAVIMLLSVMPVAYAAEKVSLEIQEHIDAYIKMERYNRNLYKYDNYIGGLPTFVDEFIDETTRKALYEIETRYPDYAFVPYYFKDNPDAETISEGTEIYKAATKEIEALLKEHKITVVIDTYEYLKYMAKFEFNWKEIDNFLEKNINREKIEEALLILDGDVVEEFYPRGELDTQEEFDACWKNVCPVLDAILNCLDGKHDLIKADETNTLVCEFCGVKKSVKDVFIEEYARWGAYFEFCSYAEGSEAAHRYINSNLDENTLQDILRAGKENDEEKMLSYIEMFGEKNAEIEKAIADGKLTVVIDGYYVALLECKVFFYSDYLEYDINGKPLYIYERNAELFEEADAAYQKANDIRLDGGTQEEFDAAIKKWVDAYSLGLEHVFGEHDFKDYISNGDATEKADGTKTATCDFCGATDTVVDEGSKIVTDNNNDNDNNTVSCSCNCHKKGFMAFIWKILTFFYKIFGMNKTCACGIAHY